MKNIGFINESLATGDKYLINGEWVDLTDSIQNCDHSLIIEGGFPSDILCCKKCGWYAMLRPGEIISKKEMEQYEIQDMRRVP